MAAPYRDIDHPDYGPGPYTVFNRVLEELRNIDHRLRLLQLEFHTEMEEIRRELHLRAGGTPEPQRGMAGDVDDAIDDVLGVRRGSQGERPPVAPQDIDFNSPNMDRLRDIIVEEARRQINEPVTDEMEAPASDPEPPDDTPHVVGSI